MQGLQVRICINISTRVLWPYLLPHVRILQALERVHREQQVRDTLLQCSGVSGLRLDVVLNWL
jgi:hypothetical protein